MVGRGEILKTQSELEFYLGVERCESDGVALFILSMEDRVTIHPH